MNKLLFTLGISLFFISCEKEETLFDNDLERNPVLFNSPNTFANQNINQETKNLYDRLISSTQRGIAFGQQSINGTGFNLSFIDREGNPIDESVITESFFRVSGDQPAIVGFDLEGIENRRNDFLDGATRLPALDSFIALFSRRVIEAHKKGSIITISWHYENPRRSDPLNFNNVVTNLLEGGIYRESFLANLSKAAKLFKSLVDEEGNTIPILFRPWHEMNGDFFFWGEPHRTTEEFTQLWRDTVNILSKDLNVNNLIYVYAPNFVNNKQSYLKNYPGDAYVDFLGIDVYDFRNGKFLNTAIRNLKIVEEIANEKNMLFALTETGFFKVPQSNWYTESLYKAIKSSAISYAMVWRNERDLIHIPTLGHPFEENYTKFIDKEIILLSKETK